MNLLSDIITYIRRIIKSPSDAVISDNLIIDYINRFWIMDVDARMQLFDLKTKYQFQTSPGVDQYNMPLYDIQVEPGNQNISWYPVYQGFLGPAYINGIECPLQTQQSSFWGIWPKVTQQLDVVIKGDGGTSYDFYLPILPRHLNVPNNPPISGLLRGHIDISGIIASGQNLDPPVNNTLLVNPSTPYNGHSIIPITSVDSAFFITSIDATGANVVVQDSGQFLTGNVNEGLLMKPGTAPWGCIPLPGGYSTSFTITGASQSNPAILNIVNSFIVGQSISISGVNGMTELNGNTFIVTDATPTTVTINVDSTFFTAYTSGGVAKTSSNTVNYLTGHVQVTFPVNIPAGNDINVQCYYFQTGLPRAILYYNNSIIIRSPPDQQYLVELDAYLSPAAFLSSSQAVQFGYMSEYIARGAARKILSDTGDVEQFLFYEPLFKEQELLVWKRSQRQFTATRTETLYSQGFSQGIGQNNMGGSGTV